MKNSDDIILPNNDKLFKYFLSTSYISVFSFCDKCFTEEVSPFVNELRKYSDLIRCLKYYWKSSNWQWAACLTKSLFTAGEYIVSDEGGQQDQNHRLRPRERVRSQEEAASSIWHAWVRCTGSRKFRSDWFRYRHVEYRRHLLRTVSFPFYFDLPRDTWSL